MASLNQQEENTQKDILLRVESGVLTLPAGSDEEELLVRLPLLGVLPGRADPPEQPKSEPDTRSERSSPMP